MYFYTFFYKYNMYFYTLVKLPSRFWLIKIDKVGFDGFQIG